MHDLSAFGDEDLGVTPHVEQTKFAVDVEG
jgi:hypothetical protein